MSVTGNILLVIEILLGGAAEVKLVATLRVIEILVNAGG